MATTTQIPKAKLVFQNPDAMYIRTKYEWRKIIKTGAPVTATSSWTNEASRKHEAIIEGNVEVIIDIPEIIRQISSQVLSTKGGRSKLLNGLVTARVITSTSKGTVTTEIPITPGYVEVQK